MSILNGPKKQLVSSEVSQKGYLHLERRSLWLICSDIS